MNERPESRSASNSTDPAPAHCDAPWSAAGDSPILIRTLGHFDIKVEGASVLPRRVSVKPLELFKCMLAAGPAGATRERLGDVLWPDAEGDAQRVLEINVHRLRRMLGRHESIIAANGRLGLNPALCWVDAIAFEEAVMQAEDSMRTDNVLAIRTTTVLAMRAALLYAGHFLEHEPDHPWILRQRERLRSRFVSMVERLARRLDRTGDALTAVEIYRVAVARDPINEIFNSGLVDALQRAGRRAEAILAYRRFEQVTRAVHDSVPSERMRRLRGILGA